MTEVEMIGWTDWMDMSFEQGPRVGDGQGSLVCCCPWGCKELDTTEQLTELRLFCWLAGLTRDIQGGASGNESTCQCRRYKRHVFNPWVRKIPWRRKWQPTQVFLPGKSHRQRSLAGYGPWGLKELDTT